MELLLAEKVEKKAPLSAGAPGPPTARILGDPIHISELMNITLKQGAGRQAFLVSGLSQWSSAGQLEQKHQQELVEAIKRLWNPHESSDVARFVRLSEGGGEVMLYATTLTLDSALAVVFDSTVPLTRMRGQVSKLAQALRAYFAEVEASQTPAAVATESQAPARFEPVTEAPADFTSEAQTTAPLQEPAAAPKPAEESLDLFSAQAPTGQAATDLLRALENEGESTEDEGELLEVSLSDLLAAMPSPDPQERSLNPGIEWVMEDEETERKGDEFLFPWERTLPQPEVVAAAIEDTQPIHPKTPPPIDPEPAVEETIEPSPAILPVEEAVESSDSSQPALVEIETEAPVPGPITAEVPEAGPALAGPAESLPPVLDAAQIRNRLEDIEASAAEFASLTYTCVMIPALPETKLHGPLADRLEEWLAQLCLAYGWRLIAQAVRLETFQWTVQVSQVVSPGNIVRLVRLQTSQKMLDEFGKAAGFTSAGQFWAQGYLIISGALPPEEGLVQNFVEQSRKRMGMVK
jgi:hypothetical protein